MNPQMDDHAADEHAKTESDEGEWKLDFRQVSQNHYGDLFQPIQCRRRETDQSRADRVRTAYEKISEFHWIGDQGEHGCSVSPALLIVNARGTRWRSSRESKTLGNSLWDDQRGVERSPSTRQTVERWKR